MIVAGDDVARFVASRLDFVLCPPYTSMGIERDGEIVAGVLFNNFEGCSVHATMAGSGWTKGFIQALGRYVFDQLGCDRFTCITERPDVVDYVQRLGGQVEGRLRDQFGKGRDASILGVLRDEWRYGRITRRG